MATTVDRESLGDDGFLAEMQAFIGTFDSAVARALFDHEVLDILQEEQYQRARLADQQEEAFYHIEHEAWACLGSLWRDLTKDHQKMAFTEKLMSQYYDRVVTGEKWWSELMLRRDSISQEKRQSSFTE